MREESPTPARTSVPIVVVLFHRESATRRMFEQLRKVTGLYSLALVDNGFEDSALIDTLRPSHYVSNECNAGAIRGINQGIALADGEYTCVLHSDVLIYDDGWLDEIVDFMESRPDVGLVGLQGAHTVKADGRYDYETNVVPHRGAVPPSLRPTWRFTEVAMIDGVGWVMRNVGIKLDERYGLMHCYDVDLALQYVDAGFSVYVRATDFLHLIQEEGGEVALERSSRGTSHYLDVVGGDDEGYFDTATEKLRDKWRGRLPVTRGFRDEAYGRLRPGEIRKSIEDAEHDQAELRALLGEIRQDTRLTGKAIEEAEAYVRDLEAGLERRRSAVAQLSERLSSLEGQRDVGPDAGVT
jgi:GT2 family glycosyltransferase